MGFRNDRRRRNFSGGYDGNSLDRPPVSETPISVIAEEPGVQRTTSVAGESQTEPTVRPRQRSYGPGYGGGGGRSSREMFFRTSAQVTVVVLTHQAEPFLEPLLQNLSGQVMPYSSEVLVLDHGSTDRTHLILRSRGIRNYPITGKKGVRETAARLAEGEAVVFITQDTLPMDRQWLGRLVAPILEKRKVGIVHGRLMADTSVPPYQRGLIQARPYVSGSAMLYFSGFESGPGAEVIPHTNVAISAALLQKAGSDVDDDSALLKMLYGRGEGKLYVPAPVAAVRRGELPRAFLAPGASRDVGTIAGALGAHGKHLISELRELGQRGELPTGERGEAYAVAIAIRAAQAASLVADRCPLLVSGVGKLAPRVKRLLQIGQRS